MKKVKTFTATIYCGFRPGYGTMVHLPEDYFKIAENICQEYCDSIGYCVTVEPTKFIYKGGSEEGVRVGLINYPRFPNQIRDTKEHAMILAEQLKSKLKQESKYSLF